ncbi:MAG: hypothetical protein PHT44_01110 [Candidatus Portnoybacteria bacterium]|nr:hypothetical protein [Candidatus Portnoybacteria bacterium]MDD4982796.1 hypothetical protein [Candidatus Portnoybacteria bacterium]
MKLIFDKPRENAVNALRRAGYSFLRKDEQTGEMSFTKRIGNADYPRFHIYTRTSPRGSIEVNLHLDQKKASYEGTTAHSGEYNNDNKWLEQEAEMIKKEFI